MRARARALGCDGVALDHADVLGVRIAATSHVSGLDLSIDGIFVLATRVGTCTDVLSNSNLASVVLVVAALGWGVTDHVHVRAATRVVLLAIVGGELVLILEEGVLGAL